MTKESDYIEFDNKVKTLKRQGLEHDEAVEKARTFFKAQVYFWWVEAVTSGILKSSEDSYKGRTR